MDQATINTDIAAAHEVIARLRTEVGRAVIGQEAIVDRLVIALLIRGHVLLEGVPGLAKTLLVRTLAGAIDASFHRIQFTPDLLPADITGTLIFDPAGRAFTPRQGPIFANLVLADEINRAPAKVQSALLEAMQERQVTIGDTSYPLPDPFVVIATQNPIEHEGTYALPEAQVDRFVMKLRVDYPTSDEELRILGMYLDPTAQQVAIRRIPGDRGNRSDRAPGRQRACRRAHQPLHHPARVRDAQAGGLQALLARAAHCVRRLAARDARARARGQGLRIHPGARVCDPRGCEGDRTGMSCATASCSAHYEAAAEQVTADAVVEQVLGAVAVP